MSFKTVSKETEHAGQYRVYKFLSGLGSPKVLQRWVLA